jgi:hypothetical protein
VHPSGPHDNDPNWICTLVVLQDAVLTLFEVEARDEVCRPVISTGAEPVQVGVGPAHRRLDHLVQRRQGQVASELLGIGRP